MKTKSFFFVTLLAFFAVSSLFAQEEPVLGHYLVNCSASASSDEPFSTVLNLKSGERQSSDHITPIDALLIINHTNGNINSLEGTIDGQKVEFKATENRTRGTHHPFIKFEANGEKVTVTFKYLDNDGSTAGRQQNRRVELSILKN